MSEFEWQLLADRPETIPQVALWYFREWCEESGRYRLEEVQQNVAKSVERTQAPLILLGFQDSELACAGEFKLTEMDMYPDYEHWIGGIYVDPQHRGLGLGRQLVERLMAIAKRAGVKQLYLQTERLDGGLYSPLGFKPIHQVNNKGVDVRVMVANLER
ncbi:GNAT family N-acetyltransferase [Paraferrimonas sedimenticola]|uniref:N-acetyltransferase n=1 Tax=Paraferrimonas sedimenticola TaxID=375674 RepID=A0AA37RKA0_9GAMM|nr:GNAT family N-acetyltransferase [Paraferrimonas sedimenticola]GLP94775.1 N-acetyltransferase [Paraferrimonas sedimenticola]